MVKIYFLIFALLLFWSLLYADMWDLGTPVAGAAAKKKRTGKSWSKTVPLEDAACEKKSSFGRKEERLRLRLDSCLAVK